MGHWFYGITCGHGVRNGFARAAQYAAATDPGRCLELAKAVVSAKALNQRTLLRRNGAPRPERALRDMPALLKRIDKADDRSQLLGLEGSLARIYFGAFASMVKARDWDAGGLFEGRNRRPPRDPVNALLSFAYALLTKECTVALLAEGLDAWWGLYHQPRHGRPGLALDLMEEFRATVADSAVLTTLNTGMARPGDFTCSPSACLMKPKARKALIQAYEARLDQLVTHPVFGYRCSWRAVIRTQARLLSRWLRGDVPHYVGLVTR
jgi:CRISPR-associated protein Cas1